MDSILFEQSILGRWIRSESEEGVGEIVFRAPDYEFPRERQPLEAMSLQADGIVEFGTPDVCDRLSVVKAFWSVKGCDLDLTGTGRLAGRFKIVDLQKGRLVLRRADSSRESTAKRNAG